jgi:hypothetical protein
MRKLRALRPAVFALLALCLVLGAAVPVCAAQDAPPTKVFLGMHVVAIRSLDVRAQSFFADFYLWIRFATADADRAKEIDEKLEAINGKFDAKEEVDRKEVGGQTYVCYRITGTFFFTATLANYPFDSQSLDIILENSNLESDSIVFVDDTKSYERGNTPRNMWGVNPAVRVPEFTVKGVERSISTAAYATDFGDPTNTEANSDYSRFKMSIRLERTYLSYVFKIVIPLMVILAMAYLVFWLPAKNIDSATGIIITALLSCMAFNVAVTDNMPEVGYLVLSDKFFIASYVLLLVTLAETITTYVIDDRGNAELAVRIDRVASWLFPISVAIIFACVALAR